MEKRTMLGIGGLLGTGASSWWSGSISDKRESVTFLYQSIYLETPSEEELERFVNEELKGQDFITLPAMDVKVDIGINYSNGDKNETVTVGSLPPYDYEIPEKLTDYDSFSDEMLLAARLTVLAFVALAAWGFWPRKKKA